MYTQNQVDDLFKAIASAHLQLNSYGYGDFWEIGSARLRLQYNTGEPNTITYPLMWATPQTTNIQGNQVTSSYKIMIADLVTKGEVNETEVISDCELIALDLLAILNDPAYRNYFILEKGATIEPFTEKLDDEVSGVILSVSLRRFSLYDRCAVPVADIIGDGSTLPSGLSGGCGVWRNGSGAPSSSLGNNNDYYLDTSNGDVYYKSSSAWAVICNIKGATGSTGATGATGATGNGIASSSYNSSTGILTITYTDGSTYATSDLRGSTGATGATGAAGSVWYNGSGAPSSGQGANGDYYLNTANGDVYVKSSGSWVYSTNIKGATGSTGATGAAGASGVVPIATAGATVNAQTGTYSPTITLATNTVVILNSVGLNTSPSPTATIDSNAAKTIVRAGNQPLMAGDTGLAGYPMMLVYNGTNLVLMNPFIDNADRTQIIKDEDEFIGTSTANGWSSYVSGTGASGTSLMSTFGKGNGWGWFGGTCGTTTTGRVMFLKLPNSNEYFQLGNGLTVIEYNSWTTKQSNNLPNGTDTYTSIIGWGDTTNSTNQNNGCYFSLGWSGSAVVWSTVTSAAGTRTTTTSAASIPTSVNDFFDFRIVVSTDRSNVYFYLRKNAGTWELANTHTTNIPANSTSGQVVPMYGCFKSAGTNSENIFLDHYRSYTVLTTPR